MERFILAQKNNYQNAFQELKNGKKTTHWMWFIFPQIKGLGKTDIARKYEIQDLEEADAYLSHPLLGNRIIELTEILVNETTGKTAEEIFGHPDFLKFHSSLTLFYSLTKMEKFSAEKYQIFGKALDKYYEGRKDEKTLQLLKSRNEIDNF